MHPDNPSPPPQTPPPAWVWEALNAIEQKMTEQHQRIRSDMNAGFDRLGIRIEERLEKTALRLQDVDRRVTTLEVEGRTKSSTWPIILAWGGFVFALIMALGEYIEWRRLKP